MAHFFISERRKHMGGTLTYWVDDGKDRLVPLRLTICSDGDGRKESLAGLRRKRLARILREAQMQGVRLSYRDLGMIMLTSRATLKRDVTHLRGLGVDVPVSRAGGNGR
jgi:hypothetical protein